MASAWATTVLLVVSGLSNSTSVGFFDALGLTKKKEPRSDAWRVGESSTPFPWMTIPIDASTTEERFAFASAEPFAQVLDRMSPLDINHVSDGPPGVINDPDRWRYKHERSGSFYKRRTKLELPNPNEVWSPFAVRDWKAQEKLQIPVPVPIPAVEQLFVYGQFDGSGDALNNQQTALYGKTGVGLKWLLVSGSELQLRYATLLSYADELSVGRFQERAQPAVEVMARMPIVGPLEIEYTGSAIPAIARTDTDQLRQELRFALPFRGDNELELGARYRWEYAPVSTPWVDRAQLFFGVRLRH
jgi:hypothetical protein